MACTGADDTTADGGTASIASAVETSGCAAIELDFPDDGVQITMALPVPPNQERQYCQLVMLDRDVNLNWVDGYFTQGSHHGSVFQTTYHGKIPIAMVDGTTFDGDPTQPHPCSLGPAGLWETEGVIAAGRSVRLQGTPNLTGGGAKGIVPQGVARRLKEGDVVLMNFHMINSTEEPLDSCLKLNLHGIPADDLEQESGVLFLYDMHIAIPAASAGSARMACPVLQDVTLLTAVSHMHALGVGSQAHLWDRMPAEPGAKMLTQFYDQSGWIEPTQVVFEERTYTEAPLDAVTRWVTEYRQSRGLRSRI